MRYVVTGAAGFIGSNIVITLVKKGHEVVAIDSLITGRKKNLTPVMEMIDFMWADIRDINVCKSICGGADYVLHQAALGSVPRSFKDPKMTHECNADGTLNMLIAARDAGVKRFVYAASSSIYGDTKTLPKVESMGKNPINPYAVSKMVGEEYARVFNRVFKLETVSLRYFNVFGPRQDPHGSYAAVIPHFIDCAVKNIPSRIYGDGEQTRDFTYVKDAVDANILACESEGAPGNSFNIGGGSQISINGLHRAIRKITNSNCDPEYVEPRQGDIRDSLADISLARKILGYNPYADLSFDDCLGLTVEWFRRNYK